MFGLIKSYFVKPLPNHIITIYLIKDNESLFSEKEIKMESTNTLELIDLINSNIDKISFIEHKKFVNKDEISIIRYGYFKISSDFKNIIPSQDSKLSLNEIQNIIDRL